MIGIGIGIGFVLGLLSVGIISRTPFARMVPGNDVKALDAEHDLLTNQIAEQDLDELLEGGVKLLLPQSTHEFGALNGSEKDLETKEFPEYSEALQRWFWTTPYIRKLLALVTKKTESAALGLINAYSMVENAASLAGREARTARKELDEAGDGVGVEGLISAVRKRIALEQERAKDLQALADKSRQQTREGEELIQRVTELVTEITDIADRSKVISISLSIEAAKIGQAGAPFKVIAGELRKLNTTTFEASSKVSNIMEDFARFQKRQVEGWQQAVIQNTTEAAQSSYETEGTIESLVLAIETIRVVFDRLIEKTIASESAMSRILEHLQFQDITRQQIENVDQILGELLSFTRDQCRNALPLDDPDAKLIETMENRMSSIFKVVDETSVLGGKR
jgi:hypothetical protein